MTTIAVTGHEGRIGSRLIQLKGYTPLECDITNFEQTLDTVSKVNPDIIIHCAAMTDVGWCENNEKKAFGINVRGTANVLEAFAGKFIYLSTVHVFDGQRRRWDYTEKHVPNAVNIYGLTKLAGEQLMKFWDNEYLIVRISKAFTESFIKVGVDLLNDGMPSMECPTFITRSFVYVNHLVDGIAYVAENDLDVDLLNISGIHTFSYYDFWIQVARVFGIDEKKIIPRKHEIDDYPRPFRGGLDVGKAKRLGVPLYSAVDGLELIKENM